MLIVIRILFSDAAKRNELRITMSICDLTATPDALKSQMLIVIRVLFREAAKRTELRITMSICDLTATPEIPKAPQTAQRDTVRIPWNLHKIP